MELVPAKCTHCGADLQIDSAHETLFCQYCGSKFFSKEAIQLAAGGWKAAADKLFADAETFLKFGDIDNAKQKFRQLISDHPADPRGWFGEVRTAFLTCSKDNTSNIGWGGFPRPLSIEMDHALACGVDKDECIAFFNGILGDWEKKASYPLFTVQPRDNRYYYYRGKYGPIFSGKTREQVCEPEGALWLLVCTADGTSPGYGDAIRTLGDEALTRRVDGWCRSFRDMYLNGKAVGSKYSLMPELKALADARNQKIMSDPSLVCDLLNQAGLRVRYDRREGRYYESSGSAPEPRGLFGRRRPAPEHEQELVIRECTVIGRTLKLVEYHSGSMYESDNYYLLPRVVEI